MRREAINVGGRMVPPSEAGTIGAQEADRIYNQRIEIGDSECFPAGTMVLTPNGYRDIAELEKGDTVSSVDVGSTNTNIHSRSILKVVKHGVTKLWGLHLLRRKDTIIC